MGRERLPTPVFWSGEFSPWGRKESDTIEQLSLSLNKTLTEKKQSQEMEKYLESCIQIQTVPKVPHVLFSNLNCVQLGFCHLQVRGTN